MSDYFNVSIVYCITINGLCIQDSKEPESKRIITFCLL